MHRVVRLVRLTTYASASKESFGFLEGSSQSYGSVETEIKGVVVGRAFSPCANRSRGREQEANDSQRLSSRCR
jgi:hypothetical protein